MKPRNPRLALFSSLLFLAGGAFAQPAVQPDCDAMVAIIVNNIREDIISEKAPTLNPEDLAFFMEHGYRNDIPYEYIEGEEDFGKTDLLALAAKRRNHTKYLARLAKAYQHPSSEYYQDPELLAAIAKGYDFWVQTYWIDTEYVPGWWYRRIGFLKEFMEGAVLLQEPLTEQYPETAARIVDYGMYAWTEDKSRMFAANALDVARITMMVSLIAEDCELLEQVSEYYQSMILPRTKYLNPEEREEHMHTEGFQVDMNFNQHPMYGRQLYLGSYGLAFFAQLTKLAREFRGTPYSLSKESLTALQDYVAEGLVWMFYRGFVDPAQLGRTIERQKNYGVGKGLDYRGSNAYTAIQTLAKVDGADEEALLSLAESLTDKEVGDEVVGNKMYWRFDYMVHRRPDYYISYRMTSTRTIGNESGNEEGENYYYTGDGWNSIVVEGDEYEDIYPYFDWRRLPGTTILQRTGPLPIGHWGRDLEGGSEFAGGCSNGDIGSAAFILSRDGVTAHKAQFFFDWGMVALGAGIEVDDSTVEGDAVPLMTTLNQTWADDETPLENVTPTDVDGTYLWHDSIGYVSLDDQPIQTRLQETPTEREILWLGIEHPADQENSYAYMILPSMELEEFTSGGIPEVEWMNTADCQAIIAENGDQNVLQAVIYEAGSYVLPNELRLTVDKPVVILLTSSEATGDISLYTANPFADRKIVDSISIEIDNPSDERFPIGRFPVKAKQPQDFYSGQSVKVDPGA